MNKLKWPDFLITKRDKVHVVNHWTCAEHISMEDILQVDAVNTSAENDSLKEKLVVKSDVDDPDEDNLDDLDGMEFYSTLKYV